MPTTRSTIELARVQLNKLPLPRLREEADRYGIHLTTEDCDRWIDAIIDHLIRNDLSFELSEERSQIAVGEAHSPGSSAAGNTFLSGQAPEILLFDTNSQTSTENKSVSNYHLLLLKQFEQQQKYRQVPDTSSAQQTYKPSSINKIMTQGQVPVLPAAQQTSRPLHVDVNIAQGQVPVLPAAYQMSRPSLMDMDIPQNQTPVPPHSQHTFTSFPNTGDVPRYQKPAFSSTQDSFNRVYETPVADIGQSVKFLTSSISFFGGTEEEDVSLWLDKIETIATSFNLSPMVRLSAATVKLNKVARCWFDLSSGDIYKSWTTFKVAITRRFKRRIVFTVVMQKIESRKWNYSTESFQKYAMDKLLLMQPLGLKDDDIIYLSINGISHLSIKSAAATIRADSVDHFLDEMHHLTTICSDSLKKN
ncbi:hypothetical protein RF55_12579 [Lasius niger]|uniref:Uncharacterized protein n=1 Tax=Lasius niger TaxID=67767 RepID=A0A0J7KCN8_LASNI|nr:hypothetical protein RF55_12579 [Lasius niger]